MDTDGPKECKMRTFNTAGICIPGRHYMVDISGRVEQIAAMVERGNYFCMNRARQYGKTTTLVALEHRLLTAYSVARLDFQGIGKAGFASEEEFVRSFCRLLRRKALLGMDLPTEVLDVASSAMAGDPESPQLGWLTDLFILWCQRSRKPVVLIIDEVDSATNNQVFLDFLAQLRLQYLEREANPTYPAFRSVILAGVTDIRHLRSQIRPDDQHKVNSPWNIATNFDVRMAFSLDDIRGMLEQYEADHNTGMDVLAVAREVRAWTGGYPFLVSRICQIIDERALPWAEDGVSSSAKVLLSERNTLFDSLTEKLRTFPELRQSLRDVLMEGRRLPYNPDNDGIQQLAMYGLVRNKDGFVCVANRIFETRLYNLFLGDEEIGKNRFRQEAGRDQGMFVKDGRLQMRKVLSGFARTYEEVFGPLGDRFPEKDGRELFLLYLKPIINGTGNYYIEAQTRDQTRTDVIVDYAGEQFVVELKVWRGPRYNEAGERQVAAYLNHFGLNVGYMLSFNFNKHKVPGLRRVTVDDKLLWEQTI